MCYNTYMGKASTKDVFIQKANKVHNGKYDYSRVNYVNSRTKVIIVCPKHGPFKQLPSSHIQGNGCPMCMREWTQEHKDNLAKSSRKSRGITTEEWVRRAKEVHGNKYDYSQTEYVNQRTNVKIICPVHGTFSQKADSHIRGSGCKLCGQISSVNNHTDHTWSDVQRQKVADTCMSKYGATRYLDSDEGKKKMSRIRNTNEFRRKMKDIISSDVVQNKMRHTCELRYGVAHPTQLKEVQDKIYATKKKNHTVSSSKSEIRMYDVLVEKFGKDDVIHQYKHDDRYPFMCDFYICSLDLFIELNAHWTHGKHWYDSNNPDDAKTLSVWTEKMIKFQSSYFKAAIYIWTVRDLLKRKTAVDNNLNYLVFWKNDLSDFYDWLNSDHM